jgi:hypothetical protein
MGLFYNVQTSDNRLNEQNIHHVGYVLEKKILHSPTNYPELCTTQYTLWKTMAHRTTYTHRDSGKQPQKQSSPLIGWDFRVKQPSHVAQVDHDPVLPGVQRATLRGHSGLVPHRART